MSYVARTHRPNRILASLPPEDDAYLASISRPSRPPQGQVLVNRSTPAGEVWFPHGGVIALTATDTDGRSVQTGLVGKEGCVGLEPLFDSMATLPDAVVQIEGAMSVMTISDLRAALSNRPSLQAALLRFLFGLSAQSLQTIACNRLHSLVSRCCRWLLTIQDLTETDDLPMTQENLATLLGSGRPRINAILAGLENKGLLRRRRGHIRLLDRSGLETGSCECYAAVRHIFA
jgi:CRP-like cAMP-binding protein